MMNKSQHDSSTILRISRRNWLRMLAIGTLGILGHRVFKSFTAQGQWSLLSGQGLPKYSTSFEYLLYTSDEEMYLGGGYSNYSDEQHFPVLYQSVDAGASWKSINLPDGMREVHQVFVSADMLTLVMLKDRANYTFTIIQSSDSGMHWEEIPLPATGIWVHQGAVHIDADGQLRLFATIKSPKNQSCLWAYDKQYKKCHLQFSLPEKHSAWLSASHLLLAGYNFATSIKTYSYNTAQWQEIPLPDAFMTQFACETQNGWCVGGLGQKTRIIALENGAASALSWGRFADYQIHGMHAYNQTICCNVSAPKSGTIMGVSHALLLSRDAGATWHLVDYPFSLITEPASLWQDKIFTVYQGTGRLQKFLFY